jgi:uncharacterized Zn-binding protein involved in type VI secretion
MSPVFASIAALMFAAPAMAQEIPACALSGSMTVMIGGKPAFRLSDVAKCPAELYDVISSVNIDGQPVVHFRTGKQDSTTCTAKADPGVSIEGKSAQGLGDVTCSTDN